MVMEGWRREKMSTKEEIIELIRTLPDTATTADVMEELYFKQQVERGLEDVAEGRTISHEEFLERMREWRKSAGR
jgi:predicted transcriptional regulator